MDEAVRTLLLTLWLLIVIGVISGAATCLTLIGQAVWPTRCERVREVLLESPGRSLILGVLNLLAFVFVSAVLHQALNGLVFLCLAFFTIFLLVLGFPAACTLVGERVRSLGLLESTPLSSGVTGTVVVAVAALMPLVGQLMLLAGLVTTFGASLRVFFQRSERRPVEGGTELLEPSLTRLRRDLEEV